MHHRSRSGMSYVTKKQDSLAFYLSRDYTQEILSDPFNHQGVLSHIMFLLELWLVSTAMGKSFGFSVSQVLCNSNVMSGNSVNKSCIFLNPLVCNGVSKCTLYKKETNSIVFLVIIRITFHEV